MSSEMRELVRKWKFNLRLLGPDVARRVLESCIADVDALLARTEAGADGWPDIKPDGFDAREIAACNDIEQLRNWAGCMRRERDNWRQRAQDAELALSDTHPQDARGDAGFSAKELHMLGKCVTASVTLGGHYIPEGWNALLDKIAAMQAKEAK